VATKSDEGQKGEVSAKCAPAGKQAAAAQRALAEAAARRASDSRPPPREISGREGPEPTRYGDWEVRGLASDF
jgi:hypothetical protein